VARARAGDGPTFIEAKTYRYRGHYEGDPMVYRSAGEMEDWKKRDAIDTLRKRLLETGMVTQAELMGAENEVKALLDEAVEFAAGSPAPALETALDGVYGDTHGGRIF